MPDANVRVICRFRPANERERRENVAAKQAEGLTLDVPDNHTVQVIGPGSKEALTFSFDHVFNESAAQKQVYEITARPTVDDMLDGYNGTIFAYGQTGAGKTYTMLSNVTGALETRGIVPRACSQLFSHIEQDTSGTEYTIKCSFLEIYKEGLRDLLEPKSLTKLKIRETPAKGVWVEGLTEAFVGSESDIFSLLSLGEQSRSVASTNMNAVSSRSHTLFVITLVQKLKDGSTKTSRLNLADLAGSEKVGKTGASGETLEEAKKINQSLSALGNCIVALTKSPDKRKHVPYRDSKLTFILRESLGGNSKTTLLIACSPHLYNLEETISTLRFGQRAKSIKNSVKINAHRSVAELELIVGKLQTEVARLRAYTKTLEQELITRLPNEHIDLQALQQKATASLKPDAEPSRPASVPVRHVPLNGSSSSSSTQSTDSSSTEQLTAEKAGRGRQRANSGSQDGGTLPLLDTRRRADSLQNSGDGTQFNSSGLSFLVSDHSDTQSDVHSEDSDFWTPMNLVEAQLAYDKMKEELEFKLQDALEELAQARDENGIEEHKMKLTREFEAYKATQDAKLREVEALSSDMLLKCSLATEQAESLADQLQVVTLERDDFEAKNHALDKTLTGLQDKFTAMVKDLSEKADRDLTDARHTAAARLTSAKQEAEGALSKERETREAELMMVTREKDTLAHEKALLEQEKASLVATKTELEAIKARLEASQASLASDKARLETELTEQVHLASTHKQQWDSAAAQLAQVKTELILLGDSRDSAKTLAASLQVEIEHLRTSSSQKDQQLMETKTEVTKLELRLQDLAGRAEVQGKQNDEGMKLLGDLNKSLTEKNQALYEEQKALTAKHSESLLKLSIAQSELESAKTARAAEQTRTQALEAEIATLNTKQNDLLLKIGLMQNELETTKAARASEQTRTTTLEAEVASLRTELDNIKTSSTKRGQQLELQIKDLERAVVEEQRNTLQAQLQSERYRVETEVAHTETLRVRADLERRIDAAEEKGKLEKEAVEVLLDQKSKESLQKSEQLISYQQKTSELNKKLEQMLSDQQASEEVTKKRIEQLEEDLTAARVALRKTKEELEDERHIRIQAETAMPPSTPAKPISVIGRDPTAAPTLLLNSRISVPVSHHTQPSLAGGMAAGLLGGTRTTSTAKSGMQASRLLSTPGASLIGADAAEKTGWFHLCSAGAGASHSSGWRKLWVVAKDKRITLFEENQTTLVEVITVKPKLQLLQLPNTARSLVEQPTDHCFVLIQEIDEQHQEEWAFCAQSNELVDTFAHHLIHAGCESATFCTLQLETLLPQPIVQTPQKPTNAFSRLTGTNLNTASSSTPASSSTVTVAPVPAPRNTPAPRSFLSGLFG